MSKAVLISIRPEWCTLIASGKKTIEVRKTRPNQETPFKCYVYCTKSGPAVLVRPAQRLGNGRVIGEFICDRITSFGVPYPAFMANMDKGIMEASCLNYWQLHRYAYHDTLYGWHISDLKIYDQMKPLSEFRKPIETLLGWNGELGRPPQSWCYVRGE